MTPLRQTNTRSQGSAAVEPAAQGRKDNHHRYHDNVLHDQKAHGNTSMQGVDLFFI
jgi:hypothetical protein